MSDELFDLGDGLPLSDANVTITNAEFVFDTEYSADAVVMRFTFEPHEEGTEPQNQLYSVGKAFEPLDSGAAVGHTSGKHVKISKQSNFGKFMRFAQECEGFAEAAREHGADTHAAEWWIGSMWHLTGHEEPKFKDGKIVEGETRTLIVPDEFLGYADEEEAPSKPATKAPAKKAAAKKGAAKKAAAATGAATVDALREEEGGEELIEQLQALAAECEDHDAFMEQAMDLDGVAGNRVAEKAVMSSKPGSIWADREG